MKKFEWDEEYAKCVSEIVSSVNRLEQLTSKKTAEAINVLIQNRIDFEKLQQAKKTVRG